MSETKILDLFPIPVAVIPIDPKFIALKGTLKSELSEDKRHGTHYISDNSYVLNNPVYAELKEYITTKITNFMTQVLSIDGTARITQSWVNCNAPGQHTHLHPHPNSIVSGVLYFELPENSGDIIFHKVGQDNGALRTYSIRPKLKKVETKYSESHRRLKLKDGDMILFPSYLLHSVPENISNYNRWNIAFNSITEGSLGDRDSLTELLLS